MNKKYFLAALTIALLVGKFVAGFSDQEVTLGLVIGLVVCEYKRGDV